MRPRLLAPFISAVAGSALLLFVMFVVSGLRVTGDQTLLLETQVAQAEVGFSDGITLTFENDSPTTLGDATAFNATVELTDTTSFTMTWDYENDGTIDVQVGPFTGTTTVGPVDFTYTAAGTYTAVAVAYADNGVVVSVETAVTIEESSAAPVLDVTLDPATPELGEEFVVEVAVTNFAPGVIGTIQIDDGDGNNDTQSIPGAESVTSEPLFFTVPGTYEIVVTSVPLPAFTDVYSEVEEIVEVVIDEPTIELVADQVSGGSPLDVTFTATVDGVADDAVAGVLFDLGNGVEVQDDTAPYNAETTYDIEIYGTDTFTAVAQIVYVNDVYGAGPFSDEVVITIGEDLPTLVLAADPLTITAGSDQTSIVTGLLTQNDAPVAGEPYTLTLETFTRGQPW
ncbi:MAG: hypothetical protein HC893_07810 [Chloroflexaceae bacterium]|nr:hypothetical protein [Chloroflexaceae bacterium]